jgi:peptidoglycan/LPS O-acetylase OafA/YrhL
MLNNDKHNHHLKAIDSLRGLAALSVFLFHMNSLVMPEALMYRPWFFFSAGHEAVILFFVISGFILTYSQQLLNLNYKQYFIRRVFRIYPAYYLAMLLGVILFLFLKPTPLNQYMPWFNANFSTIELTNKTFFDTFTLVTNEFNHIDGVVWSLVYEVIISILILPLIWKFRRNKSLIILLGFYIFFFSERLITHATVNTVDKTIYFSVFFYIGYLVFHFQDKLKILAKPAFIPLYLFMYTSVYFSFGHGIFEKFTVRDLLSGFGSGGFLLLAIFNLQVKKILNNKVINFYGKISYSFYLLHIPLMYGVIYLFNNVLPLYIMIPIIFFLTTLISWLSYTFVEKKFIIWGKNLTMFRN